MTKAKKILGIFFSLLLVFVLVSCESTPGENPGGDPTPKPNPDEYEFVTPVTDSHKLTQEYAGKDFITDGIGEVEVSQYVDGDTAIFRTKGSHKSVTARFLGVNTPESTYKVEPWGFAASNYTKKALKEAYKIVLQCDHLDERVDTTGKRYLSWVWLISENGDSRLLNLELVEVGLGFNKANSTTKTDVFEKATYDVSMAHVRIYGQKDKEYDYSTESTQISIKDLLETYGTPEAILAQKGKGKKITVSGVVTRMQGNTCCYIQQYDEKSNDYYGLYIYGGFKPITKCAVGNSVVISGTIGFFNGMLQMSSVDNYNIKVRSFAGENPEENINVKDFGSDISNITIQNTNLFGSLIQVSGLKVTGGYNAENGAYTLFAEMNGKRFNVRVDASVALYDENEKLIESYEYFVGKTFESIKGILAYYDNDFNAGTGKYDGVCQLMLLSMKDVVLK